MVTDNKLYKVAITVDGNYVHGKYYDTLTQVYYAEEDGGDGCSYISVKPNQNVVPGTDDTVWKRSSRSGKGEKGEKGDKGDPGTIDEQQLQDIEDQIAAKQDALVSGTNIKTIGNQSILGSGNIQVGDENAVKFVQQTLSADQKSQARTNIGAQETLISGSTIKTINSQSILGIGDISVQGQDGEDGIGFSSITTPFTPDGTIIITLSNGDTITLDLNHNHPQYVKYVHLSDESLMPENPDPDTLYLIDEE